MTVEPAHAPSADPVVPESVPRSAEAGERPWLSWAQHAAVVLALVIWGRVVTGRSGGRGDGALVLGCLSLLPALVLLRPAARALLPMLSLVVVAFGVCLLTPFAFSGAQVIGEAAYTGGAFAVVRCFASTSERRLAVASALCLVSLDEFAQGFLAWWGGENPDRPMIGTFYWHNQYAAFLLPGVALGSALAVLGRGIHRLVGYLCAAVCLAGVVYSSSRASMLLAAAVLAAVLVLAALAEDRRTLLPLAGGLVALCAATTFFFTSSVFFPQTASPLGATATRAEAGETLTEDTHYRLDFWKAAVAELADRPLAGGGFGSFRELSGVHLPPAAVRPASAHNELLQALAEGGLLWGLPVIALTAAACLCALRRLRGRLRRLAPDRAVAIGGALATAALVLHAGVDFDWSYPSLTVFLGVVVGLVVAVPRGAAPPSGARSRWPVLLAACVALALSAQVAHAREATTRSINGYLLMLQTHGAVAAAQSVLATRSWYDDPRIDAIVLEISLSRGVGEPLALPEGIVRAAIAGTTDYARVHDGANAQRAAAMLALGQRDQALRASREMAERRAHSRPATLQSYAVLLNLTGSSTQARQLLAGTITRRAPEAGRNPYLGAQLYTLYRQLTKIAPKSLELRCAGSALLPLHLPLAPTASPLARSGPSDSCAFLNEKGWP